MSKIIIRTMVEIEVVMLVVCANVRYWEDSTINGVEDSEGKLTPCRKDDCWCPTIELKTGIITNWEKGKTADIHFKVCDEGKYTLLDNVGKQVKLIDGYVPKIMCPEGEGYGDYIIMKVDENGKINNWEVTLHEFQDDYES